MMNWEGFGRKRSWYNFKIIQAFAWRDLGKPRKTSVRIADLRAEILSRELPDKKQEC
jgi:hypothetical protein